MSWGKIALKIAQQNPEVEIVEEAKQEPTQARRQLERAQRESLSRLFQAHWERNELPALTKEYRFHESRKWRFDFCLPDKMIAIEIDGGTWQNGRHNRAKGYAADAEKINAAQGLGWTVFRFSDVMLKQGQEAMDAYLKPIRERIAE